MMLVDNLLQAIGDFKVVLLQGLENLRWAVAGPVDIVSQRYRERIACVGVVDNRGGNNRCEEGEYEGREGQRARVPHHGSRSTKGEDR